MRRFRGFLWKSKEIKDENPIDSEMGTVTSWTPLHEVKAAAREIYEI